MSYETPEGRRESDGIRVRETHGTLHDHDAVEVKNRVQFGPIVAGIITAIGTMLILSVLGLAIGASALEPRDAGDTLGTAAAIWGGASAIIAFFLGGWVAAKTAAVAGAGSGMMNGLMVGFGILVLVLWLTGSGVSGLIGSLGSNIGDIVDIVDNPQAAVEEVQEEAEAEAGQVDAQEAFETVQDSAWGTFFGLLIALVAAALGGIVGHNKREDVIQAAP